MPAIFKANQMSLNCRSSPAPTARRFLVRLTGIVSILLGGLFAWSGVVKATRPAEAVAMSESILPLSHNLAHTSVIVVAWFEILLGAWLISGALSLLAMGVTVAVLLVFSTILAAGVASGYSGSCGCLGFKENLPIALGRNSMLLLIVGIIVLAEIGFSKKER